MPKHSSMVKDLFCTINVMATSCQFKALNDNIN
uniref:Uncharacterized protein n=1 Tax=Rhizophora mucronata TaxID=61149 RepID=A0A2P2QWK8_RHIMU